MAMSKSKGTNNQYSCSIRTTELHTPRAFLHLSHTLSIIIHTLLAGAYAEADVVKREQRG